MIYAKLSFLLIILSTFLDIPPIGKLNQELQVQTIIKDFENKLSKDFQEEGIGSISGAIIINGKLVWSKAFGFADSNMKIPADTSTIYRIGSITKTFTAFLMMQLIEEGYFTLNDPVEKYLPELKALIGYSDSTKITFKQLANHTSGLIREPGLIDADLGIISEWEDKIISSIPTTSFLNKPGVNFSYSNIGYAILGLAVSRAAGYSYLKMVDEKIFKPLQMRHTYFIVPANEKAKLAVGIQGSPFGPRDLEIPLHEHAGRGYKVPNGGIYSTPNDLAKFLSVLMSISEKEILGKENLNLMETRSTPGLSKNGYGLGLYIFEDNNGVITCLHGGDVPGYSASFAFDKTHKNSVIIMRNYNVGKTNLELLSFSLIKQLNKLEIPDK